MNSSTETSSKVQLFNPNSLRIEKILEKVKNTLTSFPIPSTRFEFISGAYAQLIETIPLNDSNFDAFWESWVPFREDAMEHCSHKVTEFCREFLDESFESISEMISDVSSSFPPKAIHRKEFDENVEKMKNAFSSMKNILFGKLDEDVDDKQKVKDMLMQRTKIRRLKADITSKYSSIFEVTQKSDVQSQIVSKIDEIFREINNLQVQEKAMSTIKADLSDSEEKILSMFPPKDFEFEQLGKEEERKEKKENVKTNNETTFSTTKDNLKRGTTPKKIKYPVQINNEATEEEEEEEERKEQIPEKSYSKIEPDELFESDGKEEEIDDDDKEEADADDVEEEEYSDEEYMMLKKREKQKARKSNPAFEEDDEYLRQSGFSPEKDSKEYITINSSSSDDENENVRNVVKTPTQSKENESSMMHSRHEFTPIASDGSDRMKRSPNVNLESSSDDIPSPTLSKKYRREFGDNSEDGDEKNPQYDSDIELDAVKTEKVRTQGFDKPPFIPNIPPKTGKIQIKKALKVIPKTPQPHTTITPLDLNKEDTGMDLDLTLASDDSEDDKPLIDPVVIRATPTREVFALRKKMKQKEEEYEDLKIQLEAAFEEISELIEKNKELTESNTNLNQQVKRFKTAISNSPAKIKLDPVVFKESSSDDEQEEEETNDNTLDKEAQEAMKSRIEFLEKERTALLQNIDRMTTENIRLQSNTPKTDDEVMQENADLKEKLHIYEEVQELLMVELKRSKNNEASDNAALISELEKAREEILYYRNLRNKTLSFESERISSKQTEEQLRVANKTLAYENEKAMSELQQIKKENEELKKELAESKLIVSQTSSNDKFESLRNALFMSHVNELQMKMQLQKMASLSHHLKAKTERLKEKLPKEELDESLKKEIQSLRIAYDQSVEWGYEQERKAAKEATRADVIQQKLNKALEAQKTSSSKAQTNDQNETIIAENKWLKDSIIKICTNGGICSKKASIADMVSGIYDYIVQSD